LSRKYKFPHENYIYNNPVEAGFVEEVIHWKNSSAKNYAGEKGQISVEIL